MGVLACPLSVPGLEGTTSDQYMIADWMWGPGGGGAGEGWTQLVGGALPWGQCSGR